jgi:uncharacterized protein related to proFAR isomerase
MAYNSEWTQFLALVDIDAAGTDWRAEQAQTLKAVLAKYIEMRFGEGVPNDALIDLINAPGVVAAVVAALTHIAEDEAALKAAVAEVIG